MEDVPHSQDPHSFTIIAIAFELLLIPAAWFLAWIWTGSKVRGAQWSPGALAVGVLATVPLVLALAAITWTPLRRLEPIRRIRTRLQNAIGSILAKLHVWQILAISLAAGVGEEVLFRGALQPRAGLILTSLVFGLVHWITPTYAVLAALLGGYLGWLFESTGQLVVPIVVHFLYDFVALLVVRRELRKEGFPRAVTTEESDGSSS